MREATTLLRTFSCCLALLAALAATAGTAAAGDVTVERAVVATAVEGREPVGEATVFPRDVGHVIFHTTLRAEVAETSVEHVWSLDGEEKARVRLAVRGPRYRTWSSKSIPPEWAGTWRVTIVDAAGEELAAVDFTVGAAE